jgi:hypothetical protein
MKYRDQFGKMPPLKHDKIIASSEVVMHIASGVSCDIERANKLFNELRKRRIIVFDKLDRTWHGIDNRSIRHTDSDRIRMLEIRLETLENKHKKLLAASDEWHKGYDPRDKNMPKAAIAYDNFLRCAIPNFDMLKDGGLDLMIVIGGYNSSNTQALARMCAPRVRT